MTLPRLGISSQLGLHSGEIVREGAVVSSVNGHTALGLGAWSGGPKRLRLAKGIAFSKPTFPELLFGALRVPDVSGGFPPALLPRFAEAASG